MAVWQGLVERDTVGERRKRRREKEGKREREVNLKLNLKMDFSETIQMLKKKMYFQFIFKRTRSTSGMFKKEVKKMRNWKWTHQTLGSVQALASTVVHICR